MDNRIQITVAEYQTGETFKNVLPGVVFYFEDNWYLKISNDMGADNAFNLDSYDVESFKGMDVVNPYAKTTLVLE